MGGRQAAPTCLTARRPQPGARTIRRGSHWRGRMAGRNGNDHRGGNRRRGTRSTSRRVRRGEVRNWRRLTIRATAVAGSVSSWFRSGHSSVNGDHELDGNWNPVRHELTSHVIHGERVPTRTSAGVCQFEYDGGGVRAKNPYKIQMCTRTGARTLFLSLDSELRRHPGAVSTQPPAMLPPP